MKISKSFTNFSGGLDNAGGRRRKEQGIALVITLIMLSVTLVMAVAFMALARRERGSVTTTTDTTTARLAAETAVAQAQAQIAANILSGFGGLYSSNAYNLHLLVSTNYINPYGFIHVPPGTFNPTNVNYQYTNGMGITNSSDDFIQNVANLWFLPRAPVMVSTNSPFGQGRFYLDLNENGRYDQYGYVPQTGSNGFLLDANGIEQRNPVTVLTNFEEGGDPEWVGILEHPDAPHGPNNHFISRYAFIAVPAGNTLDINYIHNQARNTRLTAGQDGYLRNQGVGSWEINLAAFLADLNTNWWSPVSLPDNTYYAYYKPLNLNNNNSGYAFEDAFGLLTYRYNNVSLPYASQVMSRAPSVFPYNGVDNYGDGPIQITVDSNMDFTTPTDDGDTREVNIKPWSAADNTNHLFTLGDYFSGANAGMVDFTNRLRRAGNGLDTYDRYTFYRMLDELGSDSSPDDGKLNLNYSNAVVSYANSGGLRVPTSVGVIVGAETNLMPWAPIDFFHAASDQMLRLYTKEWFQREPTNFMMTYYGYIPRGYIDKTGMGVTNFPNYGQTNQIPAFGITNIPVLINGSFVYSPAVNRLMQLAANLYDATTNGPYNFPHVFRPIVERDVARNLFIRGYTEVTNVNNVASITPDAQLTVPYDPTQLTNYTSSDQPIQDSQGLVNVYGIPWIIGAKKGLPGFNQLSMLPMVQVTRKLEVTRSSQDPATATYGTNQMYEMGVYNNANVVFWNSYNTAYVPRSGTLRVFVYEHIDMVLSNSYYTWRVPTNFTAVFTTNIWPGVQWSAVAQELATIGQPRSAISFNWPYIFQNLIPYNQSTHLFDVNAQWQALSPPDRLPQLDQFSLYVTNYLQAYILDGNHVIDYVQFRGPVAVGSLNSALADPSFPSGTGKNINYQWSTNSYPPAPLIPYGVINQLTVSGDASKAPPGEQWASIPNPTGSTDPAAEVAYFNGFFTPTFYYSGKYYVNHEKVMQAPYTPSRTLFCPFLLQANDPLVHYSISDMNGWPGALAGWANHLWFTNGFWAQSDEPTNQPLPNNPAPTGGRYQPWGRNTQMSAVPGADQNPWNFAYKDSTVYMSDNWDFLTNAYPAVGWIGRVHRGTPWQTVDLKSTNILLWVNGVLGNEGSNSWATWTGDVQGDYHGLYFDAANAAPIEDRLLFDIFTTRFNDNSVRGTLPVNQTHLGAWSALFSGMEVLSNLTPQTKSSFIFPVNTNLLINPAGVNMAGSVVSNIVASINNTRANKNFFPYQAFIHMGDVLQSPGLSDSSPFIDRATAYFQTRGISDAVYEWLPQHIMGLVRGTEQRYVVYGYGQTLKPAPNGTVLSGNYFQMVTNYQVTAENAVRAVIRVDNANSGNPRAVVESYNVLPPQ